MIISLVSILIRPSQYLCLVQVYGYTATLLDALDTLLLGGRLLVWTVESKRHGGKPLRLAERTGLESPFLSPHVSGYVKRVTLSIAEPVDDGAADESLLVDSLFEWLGLAPVPFQIAALRDV